MLELKGIQYRVDEADSQIDILRGIDLTIKPHRFVVITGPNGGGKTTLAKTIMGLATPDGWSDPLEWDGHYVLEHRRAGKAWH